MGKWSTTAAAQYIETKLISDFSYMHFHKTPQWPFELHTNPKLKFKCAHTQWFEIKRTMIL